MVADLGTKVRVELSTDSIDSAISYCDGIDIFEDVSSMLTNIKDDIQSGAEDGIREVAEFNQSLQEDFITSNGSIMSGNLVSTILIDETSSTEFFIGTFLDYAKYVEYGRGAVFPITAKYLHYFTKEGDEVFSKSSKPAEPRPFVQPAFERTEAEAVSIIEGAINNAID